MTTKTREQWEHDIAMKTRELKALVELAGQENALTGPEAAMVIMRELGVSNPPPMLANIAAKRVLPSTKSG